MALALTFAATAPVEAADELLLAADGGARYTIVIGRRAVAAEQSAARELAHFLKEMTGAEFPVTTDDAPVGEREIVLGNTNRGSLDGAPADLKPRVPEGFAILRQAEKLLIMGNIPRGTLYGVYDFLEQELGCRFLTATLNYAPRSETLRVRIASRRYDPPLEYRALYMIYEDGLETWPVRNRLNGFNMGGIPAEKELGGGRVVGHPWHSFEAMVPVSEYFEKNPEYFSMKGGKRLSAQTQLCLTNPDVFALCLDKLRAWLKADEGRPTYNPHTLRWVSVTQNDWENWCECLNCKAIDDEEGGPSGSYVRFVNRLAEALEKEYPDVAVLMFGYMYTQEPPTRTRPRHNVIVQLANGAATTGFNHPTNKGAFLDQVRRWSKVTDRLYTWDYVINFGGTTYSTPYPSLWIHDDTIRTFVKYGLKGYFGQGPQSAHAELRDLRLYLLARCLWRPETDGRAVIDEFCRLYFGPAAPAILEYIDLTHRPVYEGRGLEIGDKALKELLQDDTFLARADAILERAEQLADTQERKLRVANQRLGIWYYMVTKEGGRTGHVMDLPVDWHFRLDPGDVGLDQQWWKPADYGGWATIRTDNYWTRQGYDYHGVAWYAVDFEYPPNAPAEPLRFYFGAVDGRCDIFLDGEKIAEQKEPPELMHDKPFFRPLNRPLQPGPHRLVLRVHKENYAAGIWKPVSIVDTSEEAPEKVRVAGQRYIDVSTELGMTHFSEYYGPLREQFENDVYPRIRAIINR